MSELSNNEAGRGFTHVYTATYEDLQTIGNAGQLTIATIPAGGAVELAGVYEAEAFAGTSSLVAPVFNTGDAFTGGQSQPVGGTSTATSIILEVTDAAIASATAGKIVIGLRIVDLGQFA